MKYTFTTFALGLLTLSLTPSCIQQVVQAFIRDEYPGDMPPSVIRDINGQPASQNWLKPDPEILPAPHAILKKYEYSYASDGAPYGFTTEFSDIVVSPYEPFNVLSYTGFSGGDRVWDPFVRKPFYIPRVHTFN